jgi:hypothetical protein
MTTTEFVLYHKVKLLAILIECLIKGDKMVVEEIGKLLAEIDEEYKKFDA